MLWFKPGELTLAYWRGQRMKYIPPISLYIFISAVYFLVSSLLIPTQVKQTEQTLKDWQKTGFIPQTKKTIHKSDTIVTSGRTTVTETHTIDPIAHPEVMQMIAEKAEHIMPKFMFFMIPFMGLILKLLFLNRKEAFFADHVVFSLHWHSFYFSIMFIMSLMPFGIWSIVATILVYFLIFYYTVLAMKNAYKIELMGAIGYSLILIVAYWVILGAALGYYLVWFLKQIAAGMP
jgi:hypothetical protein